MKKKILKKIVLTALALMCMPLMACSQTRLLTDMPTGKGIEKVYISKTMIGMAGNIADNSLGELKDAIKDINGIEVYSCEDKNLFRRVKARVTGMVDKYHAEVALESVDDQEESVIYMLYNETDKTKPIGMAIVSYEKNEINIVVIHGSIDLAKMAELSAGPKGKH